LAPWNQIWFEIFFPGSRAILGAIVGAGDKSPSAPMLILPAISATETIR
jgi:hypothetical protein